jgi:hypothetical protein
LFLLAGVAVVFYPSVASNNKPITDSDQIVEEYVDDYQVTDPIEDLEDSDTYENSQLEEDSQLEEPVHGSNITIQQEDFPDADWEDNDESDYEF